MKKTDMSKACNFEYEDKWIAANTNKTLSQEEWLKWYNAHCGQCIHMGEICMFDEYPSEHEIDYE
jgi:hypothetical protein